MCIVLISHYGAHSCAQGKRPTGCFKFVYLCTLMTSANISLKKKNFHWVEIVIKQWVHTSAVHSLRYEALGKFREYSRVELS